MGPAGRSGELSDEAAAGETLIAEDLGDVGAMSAVDSLGKELTVFPWGRSRFRRH